MLYYTHTQEKINNLKYDVIIFDGSLLGHIFPRMGSGERFSVLHNHVQENVAIAVQLYLFCN